MTNSRTLQRAATRRDLLAAGLRVVANEGFARTTTAAIAKATGKAHGTVFVHFPSRDALVTELVTEVGSTMSRRLDELAFGTPSIEQVLTAHLAALGEHEALYARVLGETSVLPEAARAQVFALQSGVAFRLRRAYEREREGDRVRVVEPIMLGNLWISLTNHYLIHRDLFAPGASVVATHGVALKTQFLALVRP
jgi:AcrR family transcriptional regulator